MIVSILSPKGGCGKSTAALTLATVFARNPDLSVAIVDADPRQSLARVWKTRREASDVGSAPFAIIADPSEASILDTLDAARAAHDLILVDLEGVAGLMASYAAATSDVCIVPMRPSALDSDAASAALRMIRDAGRTARRTIPAYILLTQTDAAIVTTSYRELIAELDEAQAPRFRTELIRRAAYERMMAEGKTLFELEKTRAVHGARDNAEQLGRELAAFLEAA